MVVTIRSDEVRGFEHEQKHVYEHEHEHLNDNDSHETRGRVFVGSVMWSRYGGFSIACILSGWAFHCKKRASIAIDVCLWFGI